ncbi:MAG: CPBP family intramembrane metalloprotease [Dehalococcoidia bacterium]|nr:CPBP family intramembrane metalloprotease [Dehalococcoidia bacterium]
MTSISIATARPSLPALGTGLFVVVLIFTLSSAALQATVAAVGHRFQIEDAANVRADQAALFIAFATVIVRQLAMVTALAIIWTRAPANLLANLSPKSWTRRDIGRGLLWAVATYGVLAAYLVLLRLAGLDALLPQSTIGEEVTRSLPVLGLAGISAVLVAPVSEEFIFRGFLLNGLMRFGFWPAAFVSGFLFAAPHFDAASLVPFTLIGVVLAWLALSSGGLRQPIVFHTAFNTASFLTLLLR